MTESLEQEVSIATKLRGANPQQAENARQFAIEAARLAANTRCHDVVVLDVRETSPVTDYLVLATGTSTRQMHTVADEVEEMSERQSNPAVSRAGDEGAANWIVLDCFDVVVHLFTDEARSYYNLDGLWGDAPKLEWEAAAPASI